MVRVEVLVYLFWYAMNMCYTIVACYKKEKRIFLNTHIFL